MRVLFLPGSHTSPPARYRLLHFVEPLKSLGYDISVRVIKPERTWSPVIDNRFGEAYRRGGTALRVLSALWHLRDIEKFDVIMMNRDIVPEVKITFLEPWLIRRNPKVIFDFDDAIFIGPRERKLRKILPKFAWIFSGNEYLATFAKEVNSNVTILPTVVNTDIYSPSADRIPGPIRIGWSGSRSTRQQHLPLLEPILTKLAEKERFDFIVIADQDPHIHWKGVNTQFIPWRSHTEIESLRLIDVGLMPLKDNPRDRGKCGLKAIAYMATGAPALVSPVGVNKQIVVHNKTGFHCASDDEWLYYLRTIISDRSLRAQMGAAARQWTEDHYSVKSILPKMTATFEIVAQKFDRNLP